MFLVIWKTQTNAAIPKNILPHKKMVGILVDLELAQSIPYSYMYTGEVKDRVLKNNIMKIFAAHNISSTLFEESCNYYFKNPQLLLAVYEEVIENLQTLE